MITRYQSLETIKNVICTPCFDTSASVLEMLGKIIRLAQQFNEDVTNQKYTQNDEGNVTIQSAIVDIEEALNHYHFYKHSEDGEVVQQRLPVQYTGNVESFLETLRTFVCKKDATVEEASLRAKKLLQAVYYSIAKVQKLRKQANSFLNESAERKEDCLGSPMYSNLSSYLGDFCDLVIRPGGKYRCSAKSIIFVPRIKDSYTGIIAPGSTVPFLIDEYIGRKILYALSVRGPANGWIAVHAPYPTTETYVVGCLVQIVKVHADKNGIITSCIGIGRHRISIYKAEKLNNGEDFSLVKCIVQPDELPPKISKEVVWDYAVFPQCMLKMYDCYSIADQLKRILCESMPFVKEFHGNPMELSYWCIRSLPLNYQLYRQSLKVNLVLRLTSLVQYLQGQNKRICCSCCGVELGVLQDIFSLLDVGPTDIFVDSSCSYQDRPGHNIYDLISLFKVRRYMYTKYRQFNYQWFSGFSQKAIACVRCQQFIGCEFVKYKDEQQQFPLVFYGLNRQSIRYSDPNQDR
eukprot:TRINITY_DN1401_c0_g1_i1.p1 TRINITY_DN1401_c0_g1~~TRINITY_DN1401_c0_g1_i1.p1  ORF type:complete len:519 (-),score=24.51 TRINITY_DN1401_c0_g1_i1:1356-2912(-)